MKKEFESLKRQLKFYKDKLQIELTVKKNVVSAKKKVSVLNTINYEDHNKNEKDNCFKTNEKLNFYKNSKTPFFENDKISEERQSLSLKKEITSFHEEIEVNTKSVDDNKDKIKCAIPPIYINTKSPNKILCLNLSSTLNKNKITYTNLLNPQVINLN